MIWADKLALGALVLIVFALFLLGDVFNGGPRPDAYARVTAAEHYVAFFSIVWLIAWKFVLPIWLALRALDFLAGGPSRRRGRFTVQRID
jgi:hypothetical protein